MRKKITIVDYGIGNILNIKRAFDYHKANVTVTNNFQDILSAEKIVIPGVGAFSAAINSMKNLNLIEPIIEKAKAEIPILGICLGMQLLMTRSFEGGLTSGLNLIEGDVISLSNCIVSEKKITVPHIGWSKLEFLRNNMLANDLDQKDFFYFVHSYLAQPINPDIIVSFAEYEGIKIPSMIAKDNVYGCQFHPEKSSMPGLKIIKNFLLV